MGLKEIRDFEASPVCIMQRNDNDTHPLNLQHPAEDTALGAIVHLAIF